MPFEFEMETDGLSDLLKKVEQRKKFLDQQNGQTVKLKDQTTFVGGPYLHQNVVDPTGKLIMSEQDSAKFERDNKPIFDFLRSLSNKLMRIFK